MSTLGIHPRDIYRLHRHWREIIIALVLGAGVFSLLNRVLATSLMSALLTICVVMTLGALLMLSRQLALARMQRDQALARATATDLKMTELLENHDQRVQKYMLQRIQVFETEISDLRSRCQLLQAQAYHDELTGLANRLLLTERFFSAAKRAKRSGKVFAVLMIDLDDFKAINDNHGHAAGDEVLITTGRRLMESIRACDTVARLGGDEFVLIIEDIEDPQELVGMSHKMIHTLSKPIALESGVAVSAGASVGMALYPHHGTEMNELLGVADQSMYECKSTGQMSLH